MKKVEAPKKKPVLSKDGTMPNHIMARALHGDDVGLGGEPQEVIQNRLSGAGTGNTTQPVLQRNPSPRGLPGPTDATKANPLETEDVPIGTRMAPMQREASGPVRVGQIDKKLFSGRR